MALENVYETDTKQNNEEISHLKTHTLHNLDKIPNLYEYCTDDQIQTIKIVGQVLPFKTNNYVVNQLINWNKDLAKDPMFILNFPQKQMLLPQHYDLMKKTLEETSDFIERKNIANKIRYELNPQPAGQKNF